jgi:L-asparaginase II
MLALCAHEGWNPAGYTAPDHPVQVLIRRTVADCCGLVPEALEMGIDGCGVPVFRAPLRAVARGYALLARPEEVPGLPSTRTAAVRRLMGAAAAHPEMVAGDERICTDVMRAAGPSLFAKEGAEASYGLAFQETGLGLFLKIEDGNNRGLRAVVVNILVSSDVLTPDEGVELGITADIRNNKGAVVGKIAPAGWSYFA